ncbi:MAG: preprotein translocase subunit YajC [Clostridia bacterium]|nr:preprotein translocase subunit YajC [Clostridia bacterium]
MPAATTQGIGSFFSGGGFLIIMLIAMFAIMIIPQRKREKKVKEMLAAIKVGDRIRTIGGIYGTVSAIKDDVITVMVGPDKIRLVFTRGAIANVENVAAENTMSEDVKEISE